MTDLSLHPTIKRKPLPDILDYDLKILFIGFNPGIRTGECGHHYAHHSNRFWRLLYESGLTPQRYLPTEDLKLLLWSYGSTNLVDRPTKTEMEISREEIKEGSNNLLKLILEYKPRIACYIGFGVYRRFSSVILNAPMHKLDFPSGVQQKSIAEGTLDFVCSSSSGLNTIPYADQLHCFHELKILADIMDKGALTK